MSFILIAIDGPSGVGKSTTAQRLAERLGLFFLSSGRIYRALAWYALQRGWQGEPPIDPALLDDVQVQVDASGKMAVNGLSVSLAALGTESVSRATSILSAVPEIRERANRVQRDTVADIRRYARFPGVILEGRDIGTVVFPDATHKFFLTASPRERARRRHAELAAMQPSLTLDEVAQSIEERDRRDSTREIAPLRPAADACVIDTTQRSLEEVVALLAGQVRPDQTATHHNAEDA